MPVIVFANSKGGVGKTTSAALLAQVLTHYGASVSLIDADPNKPLSSWWRRGPEWVPPQLRLIPEVSENTIIPVLDEEEGKSAFVLVDLEGSANLASTFAVSRADLVLIPMQGSQLDADQSKRVIDLIHREETVFRRKIPYAAYFTRTSAAIRPKDLRHIQASLKEAGVPVLPVELTERAAYRAIMQLGGTVYDLMPSEVSNPDAAIENAEAFASEVTRLLGAQVCNMEAAE